MRARSPVIELDAAAEGFAGEGSQAISLVGYKQPYREREASMCYSESLDGDHDGNNTLMGNVLIFITLPMSVLFPLNRLRPAPRQSVSTGEREGNEVQVIP